MKKQSILIIICAILTVANYLMLDRQASYAVKADQLQQEVNQLTSQVAEAREQVRELQQSHEMAVLVTEDLSYRLVRAEQGKPPVWKGDK